MRRELGDLETDRIVARRREILIAFDALRIRGHRRRTGAPADITPELQKEILRLLSLNLSQGQVSNVLGISINTVARIAGPARAATWRVGRGRRFTSEQLEVIREMIRAGANTQRITERFGCDWATVKKLRFALGDFANHKHDRKLSEFQVTKIRQHLAAHDLKWKEIAAKYAISISLVGAVKRKEHGY